MKSVRLASSEHVSVNVYSLMSALPGTVFVCWPSFATVSVPRRFPFTSSTLTSNSVQIFESPRYTQRISHSTLETHVDPTPMLVISRKEEDGFAVGAGNGTAVGSGVGPEDGAGAGRTAVGRRQWRIKRRKR